MHKVRARSTRQFKPPLTWVRLWLGALVLTAGPLAAQSPGTAQSFAILGGSAVSANGASSSINGDVGVSPGSAITGFPSPANVVPPFSFAHASDGPANSARAATLTLYNALAAAGGAIPILPGLNGQSLGPGTYSTGAALLVSGGTLTLTGAGTYIFQVASSLTADVGSNVVLIGVNPCNVYWQVTSLATLNGATFAGNVVAQTGIHLGAGARLTGRALAAAAGDVTLAGSNTVGGCSAAGPGAAATTLDTVASPTVPLGSPISDTATLTGGGIGAAAPTGTITFSLYGPTDATCANPPVGTSTVAVHGTGVYSSLAFTASATGTYRWIANYGGDLNNAPTANVCNAANESVLVTAGLPFGGATGIPTHSTWVAALLAVLLAIAGITVLRKQARPTAGSS